MPWSYRFFTLILLLGSTFACSRGPHSASGFHLKDGDAERGQKVFLALECNRCHEVAGVAIPRTVTQPSTTVKLGGPTTRIMTDGYLVTSIIYPEYAMAPGTRTLLASGAIPPMPDYSDRVTARDLSDLVAFLHGHYEEVARIPNPAYY